ncbi:conserved protein, unknown function [Plasmodium chabaudi chabaudi]|uniref:Uncharacterized protein n=1 Tax=Plasmodium chabaudi chabaudi TaxID=31271 RepID=A0A4V0K6Q3_PLACU|nr:conserved protein, unknown function [Plasmodium chabaudi chabaudi]VTZ68318.1 conserved protein, unknown function [Plasmodium chabaudi chabaudi]|eukprot:XP_016653751.1 conserved Plasmodium protein, unknown function [Plasmodium chabaudi chabaudi]
MYKDLLLCVLIICSSVFNESKIVKENLDIPNYQNDNRYLLLDKNNVSDFIQIKESSFLFNATCKASDILNGIADSFPNIKLFKGWLKKLELNNFNSYDKDFIEKVLEHTWDSENKEFIVTIKNIIKKYTGNDPFILQVGLNSIAPLILETAENVIHIEEDFETCKNFFLYKKNRCLLKLKGIEFYCKEQDDISTSNNNRKNSISNAPNKEDIYETLDLITKIYQNKNNKVIDILIITNKYPIALLYYIYPYLDSSTLVILMDNINHKMKNAIFQYYNFIGEADFSRVFEHNLFTTYKSSSSVKGKTPNVYENDENVYIYNKMKKSPFYIMALNPKIKMNPPEEQYKRFISNEYASSYETEISRMLKEIKKTLKTNKELYEKYKLLLNNYFSTINEFGFDNNAEIKKNVNDSLDSIIKSFTNSSHISSDNYKYTLDTLKSIFNTMLFNEYEKSKFKHLFTPLIDFFKLYLNTNDSNYIIYEFLLYGLITNSHDISSYESKELLFLEVLRDVSKQMNELSINEVIEMVTKLNILLKKLRSRDDMEPVEKFIKENFGFDYSNQEL